MAISVKEKNNIKAKLQKVFISTFGRNINYEKVKMEEFSKWDSLKGIELLLSIEQSFKLKLNEKDLNSFTSFEKILSLIIKKL